METTGQPAARRVVLAGSALDAKSDEVVSAAWKIAMRTGWELVIAHAVPLPHLVPGNPAQPAHPVETLTERARVRLEEQVRRLRPAGSSAPRLHVEPGIGDMVLNRLACELDARLIVLGATTSHGRLGKLLGSTAERVLQLSPVPILVVRDDLAVPPRTILAPLDLSSLAYDALVAAVGLLQRLVGTQAHGALPAVRCELLSVVPPDADDPTSPAALARTQAGIESVAAQIEAPWIRFAPRVLTGEPRDQILRALEDVDCDLVVMGTRGSGGPGRRLGVVATDVAREAPCSVLLVPPAASFGETLAAGVADDLSPIPATHRKSAPGGTNMSDWNEARRATIARWQGIRAAAGQTHPLDLLEEVNAADALCAAADEDRDAAGGGLRCEHCQFYEQFGGCQEVLGRLSERIAAHDWPAVRRHADEVLARLQALQPPPQA